MKQAESNIFWFKIDKKTNVISLDLICVLSETKINRTTKIVCIKCIFCSTMIILIIYIFIGNILILSLMIFENLKQD